MTELLLSKNNNLLFDDIRFYLYTLKISQRKNRLKLIYESFAVMIHEIILPENSQKSALIEDLKSFQADMYTVAYDTNVVESYNDFYGKYFGCTKWEKLTRVSAIMKLIYNFCKINNIQYEQYMLDD